MIVLYIVLIAGIVHNIVRYVIMQRRFVFHITYFYAIVITTVLLRMVFFVSIFFYLFKPTTKSFVALPFWIRYIDNYATYCYLILGLQ